MSSAEEKCLAENIYHLWQFAIRVGGMGNCQKAINSPVKRTFV